MSISHILTICLYDYHVLSATSLFRLFFMQVCLVDCKLHSYPRSVSTKVPRVCAPPRPLKHAPVTRDSTWQSGDTCQRHHVWSLVDGELCASVHLGQRVTVKTFLSGLLITTSERTQFQLEGTFMIGGYLHLYFYHRTHYIGFGNNPVAKFSSCLMCLR